MSRRIYRQCGEPAQETSPQQTPRGYFRTPSRCFIINYISIICIRSIYAIDQASENVTIFVTIFFRLKYCFRYIFVAKTIKTNQYEKGIYVIGVALLHAIGIRRKETY